MLAFVRPAFERCYISLTYRRVLIAIWHFGICLGLFAGVFVDYSFLSALRLSVNGDVSVAWVLISALLPYLLYFCVQCTWGRAFLVCVWGIKAFIYSFSMVTVVCSFGNAGWLACVLLLWCDALQAVLLARFYWNCSNWHSNLRIWNFVSSIFVSLLLVVINCFAVGPFRAGLHI